MFTKQTFNMKDLSNDVSDTFNLTGKEGAAITRHIFDKLKHELKRGSQVRLHRFCTLEARHRKAGIARNPQTGQRLVVPPRRVLKLTVSASLKGDLARI